ncbi:hypothetical protein [Methylovulum psychrotolerans]|uniref:Porin n=1 Tax=Methylovulum psychrotolerans TaxID=1704499 RepID=A0A2S5CKU8_9GAMM|nr:hypothetical protein [Methylovulum psychrotolerans]POZ51445.1 hypothetical protein AADEFJLK_02895 [Methylovulum psychrotolerans]
MNNLPTNQPLHDNRQALAYPYQNVRHGVSYALIVGCILSPSLASAKGVSKETVLLRKQMQEYQQQLEVTNTRLQELEQREAARNAPKYQDTVGKTAVVQDTPTAKGRNVQEQADVEDPVAAKVPVERYLKGFYDGGFSLRTQDNKFSLTINGLAQSRYTLSLPNKAAGNDNQTFDLALGRLFFSGTAFDPKLSYFFFYQTSTLSNNSSVSTIDWWGKYQLGDVGIKTGRILPQYSRQFYTDIGKYLFMDLQAPEYAFSLQRTPGAEAMWKPGKWTLSLTAGNGVRALDSGTQQNVGTKIAGIGRIVYDVLAPYDYVQETSPAGIGTPQLSVGAAFGFNPVDASSGLQNVSVGTDTYNGTADIGYRYQYFSTEAAFFWRQNNRLQRIVGPSTTNDYGWYWQAGYYVLPKRLELAGTANQVLFEYQDGSPFKNQTVGSVGLNYYFYEHNFKLQTDYSYITGKDWADHTLNDSRLRVQAQVYF